VNREMDRYWLLTWTTYGSWLPGDRRGFVSNVRGDGEREIRHNIPGTPYDLDMPALEQSARARLRGAPIRLVQDQSDLLLEQFQETAGVRGWQLLAVGIMANHCHIVTGVPGDPDPSEILGDFKSYGSRKLNRRWSKPTSGTWWTESGSKRKLPNEQAVLAAVRYVIEQEYPLAIWTCAIPELGLAGGSIAEKPRRPKEQSGERGASAP
jgi:REP element-mobilizing transposase RayT